jgi:hypothetical protein
VTDVEEFRLQPSSGDSWRRGFVAFGGDVEPQRATPDSTVVRTPQGGDGDTTAALVADDTATEQEQSRFDISLSTLMDAAVRKLKSSPATASPSPPRHAAPIFLLPTSYSPPPPQGAEATSAEGDGASVVRTPAASSTNPGTPAGTFLLPATIPPNKFVTKTAAPVPAAAAPADLGTLAAAEGAAAQRAEEESSLQHAARVHEDGAGKAAGKDFERTLSDDGFGAFLASLKDASPMVAGAKRPGAGGVDGVGGGAGGADSQVESEKFQDLLRMLRGAKDTKLEPPSGSALARAHARAGRQLGQQLLQQPQQPPPPPPQQQQQTVEAVSSQVRAPLCEPSPAQAGARRAVVDVRAAAGEGEGVGEGLERCQLGTGKEKDGDRRMLGEERQLGDDMLVRRVLQRQHSEDLFAEFVEKQTLARDRRMRAMGQVDFLLEELCRATGFGYAEIWQRTHRKGKHVAEGKFKTSFDMGRASEDKRDESLIDKMRRSSMDVVKGFLERRISILSRRSSQDVRRSVDATSRRAAALRSVVLPIHDRSRAAKP